MMTELDIFNQLHYAKEDGLAEGEAKGKAEGIVVGKAEGKIEARIETAKNLKDKGISPEIISECMWLSVEQIDAY